MNVNRWRSMLNSNIRTIHLQPGNQVSLYIYIYIYIYFHFRTLLLQSPHLFIFSTNSKHDNWFFKKCSDFSCLFAKITLPLHCNWKRMFLWCSDSSWRDFAFNFWIFFFLVGIVSIACFTNSTSCHNVVTYRFLFGGWVWRTG